MQDEWGASTAAAAELVPAVGMDVHVRTASLVDCTCISCILGVGNCAAHHHEQVLACCIDTGGCGAGQTQPCVPQQQADHRLCFAL